MNNGAGRRQLVYIELRLDTGEKGLFLLDTGASMTFLDSSLSPKLGKRRGSTNYGGYGGKKKAGVYAAPALFLGPTRLVTGRHVLVHHEDPIDGQRVLGTLGMDCLQHYCVQMDFAAGRVRFLDPDQPLAGLGQAFTIHQGALLDENLLGTKGLKTMIDTGDALDGALKIREFRKAHQVNPAGGKDWTWFPSITFAGAVYSNVVMHKSERVATLGLRFLSRHLVTLNFPKRTLYLRLQTASPRSDETFPPARQGQALFVDLEAIEFLDELREQGGLPGFLKADYCVLAAPDASDRGGSTLNLSSPYPVSRTFSAAKSRLHPKWDYHYTLTKEAKSDRWRLERAWRTDAAGVIVEEFRVR